MSNTMIDTILSRRALEYFKSSAHYQESLESDIKLFIDSGDNILTLQHRFLNETFECLFASAFELFLKQKNYLRVWKINYKEFENFLRDENHLPAFLPQDHLKKSFQSVKCLLLVESLKLLMTRDNALLAMGDDRTLVEKNKWADTLCKHLGFNLIICEKNVLTIEMGDVILSPEELDELVDLSKKSIPGWFVSKVVAVS